MYISRNRYNEDDFSYVRRSVIYVENEPNPSFRGLIEEHLDGWREKYRNIGYKFYYLTPSSIQIDHDIARYFEPTLSPSLDNDSVIAFSIKKYVESLLENSRDIDGPCLLYRFDSLGGCTCVHLERNAVNPSRELYEAFQYIDKETRERIWNQPMFSIGSGPDDPEESIADKTFYSQVFKAIEEVQKYARFLEEHGVYLSMLGSSVAVHGMLSTMVIQKDYTISLPEYHISFKLEPLPMAVYMLFLNHPEGILFKELPSYRDELMKIYGKMTGRSEREKINKSIEDLTDPMKNSINEKCSVIRREFVRRFNESLAANYIIDGKRGEPKKILLPRDMVKILI